MNFWDKVTGKDIQRDMKALEERLKRLTPEYQEAWEEIKNNLWIHSDFTGRNLIPIFEKIVEILEEASLEKQSIEQLFGGDIKTFCSEIASGEEAETFRDTWRKQLNNNIAKKLNRR